MGDIGITLTRAEYDRLLGIYKLESYQPWSGSPGARPTFEQWLRQRNEGVRIENDNSPFTYVPSSELFMALGTPPEKAESMERELNAVIRRQEIVDNNADKSPAEEA